MNSSDLITYTEKSGWVNYNRNIEKDSVLADYYFEERPYFFEYIRQTYQLHEDAVIQKAFDYWIPSMDWNQLMMVVDKLKRQDGLEIYTTNNLIKISCGGRRDVRRFDSHSFFFNYYDVIFDCVAYVMQTKQD